MVWATTTGQRDDVVDVERTAEDRRWAGGAGLTSRPVLAENIDDVVRLVGDVVDQARSTGHRRGYFAAIYLDMTRAVQEGIAKGVFDDGPRMSRFAAAFANRYLD